MIQSGSPWFNIQYNVIWLASSRVGSNVIGSYGSHFQEDRIWLFSSDFEVFSLPNAFSRARFSLREFGTASDPHKKTTELSSRYFPVCLHFVPTETAVGRLSPDPSVHKPENISIFLLQNHNKKCIFCVLSSQERISLWPTDPLNITPRSLENGKTPPWQTSKLLIRSCKAGQKTDNC